MVNYLVNVKLQNKSKFWGDRKNVCGAEKTSVWEKGEIVWGQSKIVWGTRQIVWEKVKLVCVEKGSGVKAAVDNLMEICFSESTAGLSTMMHCS